MSDCTDRAKQRLANGTLLVKERRKALEYENVGTPRCISHSPFSTPTLGMLSARGRRRTPAPQWIYTNSPVLSGKSLCRQPAKCEDAGRLWTNRLLRHGVQEMAGVVFGLYCDCFFGAVIDMIFLCGLSFVHVSLFDFRFDSVASASSEAINTSVLAIVG